MSTPIKNRGLGVFPEAGGIETNLAVQLGNQPRGNVMANETERAKEIEDAIKKADAEREEKERADAAAGETLDKALACLDSICKRLDAMEAKEAKRDSEAAAREAGDPTKVVADGVENHGPGGGIDTEQPGANNMNDSVKLDSFRKVYVDGYGDPAPCTGHADTNSAYRDAGLRIQYEANKTFGALCSSAPTMVEGTRIRDYETHLLGQLIPHSKKWKDLKSSDLARMDAVTFKNVKQEIYADAYAAATDKTRGCEGDELREYYTTDATGRRIVNFAGETGMWLKHFAGNRQRLIGIRNGSND
jgi:hypothetical protein